MGDFKEHIDKLRASRLRPTKQRLMISKLLFGQKETFHFSIEDLNKLIEKKLNKKISLATVYNTIHAFKKEGYLKEIAVEGNKTYFDTNTSLHHHFYDEDSEKLIEHLVSKGIGARTLFKPMHSQPCYDIPHSYPNSEKLFKNGLELPSYPSLEDSQIRFICDVIKQYSKEVKE